MKSKVVKTQLHGPGATSLHNWFLNERTMGTKFVNTKNPKIEYDLLRVIINDDGVFGIFMKKKGGKR